MTHDELLAKLDEKVIDRHAWMEVIGFHTYQKPKENEKPFITTLDWYLKTGQKSSDKDRLLNKMDIRLQILHNALRAVVELHKPFTPEFGGGFDYCFADDRPYPCRTIKAIEKELA